MRTAVRAGFGVKQKMFFLYNAIHKLLTPCPQVIHRLQRINASRAEFCATVTMWLLRESPVSQPRSLLLRPGR